MHIYKVHILYTLYKVVFGRCGEQSTSCLDQVYFAKPFFFSLAI